MNRTSYGIIAIAILVLAASLTGGAAVDTMATSVYARVAEGYKRARLEDGSFKPEYYALSNGGRLDGTSSDKTVDRVDYAQVAEIAQRLLARQNYQYAGNRGQASLLLVLNWGNTLAWSNYKDIPGMEDLRDQINERSAQVLGYRDGLNDADGIQRYAGAGDRYTDLITDVEEVRYYIMISAYDFRLLSREGKRRLLWQVRVSVRSPGNNFVDSLVPMLKVASRYSGQDSGKLARIEESKGTVEMGDLKFLGEAKDSRESPAKEPK